jgi:hypothetical protein
LKYPAPQQPPAYTPPPPPYEPGPSSVFWQPAQKPFVPGPDAIKGGPGNAPKPDSPLYVCRVYNGNGLYPGKWIQGECNFSNSDGKEQGSKSYEVAVGQAEWHNFDGNISALVPGGYAEDGTHLYICRKQISYFGSKKGYQPGFLENGKCHIPYGIDQVNSPPFEALYNVFSSPPAASLANQPPTPPAQAAPASEPPQSHGILISFANGTGNTAGTVTVTSGSSGTTITKPLPPNSTPQQCLDVVQQAAFEAGLQIQAQPDGNGLKVFGINNAIHVTQASITVSQF